MKVKAISIFLLLLICTLGCNQTTTDDYLIKVMREKSAQGESGYVNTKGDTVIAIGKYQFCYTDTFKQMAIVLKKNGELIAIDKKEQELFQVFWYDNGPDYYADGLFRIKKAGKIGYANVDGEIIIAPQFDCALPFENGKARVSKDCKTIKEDEHSTWESDHWFYIDKAGRKIE